MDAHSKTPCGAPFISSTRFPARAPLHHVFDQERPENAARKLSRVRVGEDPAAPACDEASLPNGYPLGLTGEKGAWA